MRVTQPPLTVWAPGRINLIGEHTDYSGGLALPAAIQLGITARVDATANVVTLRSETFGTGERFAPNGDGPAVEGWAKLGQAVARELAELGRSPIGLTATIASTLPAAVGLSSSAAIEVAIGLALCAVAEFDLEPLALAQACRRAELRAVGVPCGILDQAACVLGKKNAAILLNCATLEYRYVPVPDDVALLVVDSGVSRSLEHSGYADRRNELERALLRIGATHSAEIDIADLDGLDPLSRRRLRHVVTENKRVSAFVDALSSNDLETAGQLMSASHTSLRDDYQVSTPELDELVKLAEQQGAYGARLLGGGFGGAIIALVDAISVVETGEAIVRSYRGSATAIAVRVSDGAHIGAEIGAQI
jgi:galactokinase